MADLGVGFIDIIPRSDKFTGLLTKQMTTGLSSASSTVSKAFGVAGIAAAAFAAKSVSAFIDFQTTMTQTVTLAGSTEEQMKTLSAEILNVAGALGASPQELAETLYFTESAGISAANAMDVVTVSAKASAIGLGESAQIADAVTSVLNAYGEANITAARATDILVAAVREGKGEADAIAGAIGRVIPVASSMGVEFEQVAGGIAALTQVGLDANEAVTALRGIMTALLNPTKEASTLLDSVGLSAETVRASVADQGLLPTLQLLEDSFKGNDEAMGALFGNVRAQVGALALLGSNAADVREVFDAVANSTGSLDEAFGRVADTTGFQLQQAMAELQSSMIEFGGQLAPLVTDLASFAKTIAPMADELAKLGLAFGALYVINKVRGWVIAAQSALIAYSETAVTTAGTTTLLGKASLAVAGNLRTVALAAGVAFAAFTVGKGLLDDAHRDFGALAEQTHISAEALKFFQDRMSHRTDNGLSANLASFIGTLDGVGDQLDSLTERLGPAVDAMSQMGLSTESTNAILNAHGDVLDGSAGGMERYITLTESSVKAIAGEAEAFQNGSFDLQTFMKIVQGFGVTSHDAFTIATQVMDKHGKTVTKTGLIIKNFAGLTSDALDEFKSSVVSSFSELRKQSDLTAGNFLKDIHSMAAVAKNFASDMRKLSTEDWVPDKFLQFLLESGPAAVHDFVDASRSAQQQAIAEWRAYQSAVNSSTASVDRLTASVANVPSQKTVHIDVITTSFGKPLPGATGGFVTPYGIWPGFAAGGSTDTIPAMLSPGEFIFQKSAVDRIGAPVLRQMNQGGAVSGGGKSKLDGSMRIYDWRNGLATLDAELGWEDAVRTR